MYELTRLFASKGVPEHIRSDNGPEFTAKAIRDWLPRVGVKTLFIQPGSPWENGYNESFNGKLRIERACSRNMLAYSFGSAMRCAQDSREKRGTEIFLPERFDQGFMC